VVRNAAASGSTGGIGQIASNKNCGAILLDGAAQVSSLPQRWRQNHVTGKMDAARPDEPTALFALRLLARNGHTPEHMPR
jgi:hypothetical protein